MSHILQKSQWVIYSPDKWKRAKNNITVCDVLRCEVNSRKKTSYREVYTCVSVSIKEHEIFNKTERPKIRPANSGNLKANRNSFINKPPGEAESNYLFTFPVRLNGLAFVTRHK